MKTIKLLVLVVLSTLLLSCSENYNDDFLEEIAEEEVLVSKTYHLKEYYEKPVVINRFTSDNDIEGYSYQYDKIYLGRAIFEGYLSDHEVIDTLTIDLTSFKTDIKKIVLDHSFLYINSANYKYISVNYLNIIGLDEHPDLKIIGEGAYNQVKIYNSNIPINKLNSISRTPYGQHRNMFDKVDYERKDWEITLMEGDSRHLYTNIQGKPIGYIGYAKDDRKGIKMEIMNIIENYE